MNKEETIERLKAIVKPYIKNQDAYNNLTEKTDLLVDLQINSANLVDVILDIEEVFDIVIDNNEMQQMMDVQSVVEIIQKKLPQK